MSRQTLTGGRATILASVNIAVLSFLEILDLRAYQAYLFLYCHTFNYHSLTLM